MTNDKDIIIVLREKACKHKGLYEVYSKAADQLEGELGVLNSNNKAKPTLGKTKLGGHTFKEAIIKAFGKNIPYTAKQLFNEYISLTGKKMKYKSFSGQLSVLKKNHNVLKMHTIKENPINSRYLYGLSEWFVGNEFKKEYLDKFEL
ncbi:MAG: hypothetical protein KAU02_06180 [Tenericutes bacterium]|nr:hypothetical protein [Mycoplasmatota bacterium]